MALICKGVVVRLLSRRSAAEEAAAGGDAPKRRSSGKRVEHMVRAVESRANMLLRFNAKGSLVYLGV